MATIVGIGMTDLMRASGRTELDLALEAVRAALADAGLEPAAVDGLLSYHLNDSAQVQFVAEGLGLTRLAWHNEIYGGGSQSASILGDAAHIVDDGLAETVVVYRALNGRSGHRLGQTSLRVGENAEAQFTLPYGMRGPVHLFALVAQRYLHETGATAEDLAGVVIQSRANAARNPRASMGKPMTLDDYLASPMVATPLRRADCCQENDGAAAVVVTTDARAERLGAAPVRIRAAVRAGGPGSSNLARAEDGTRMFSHYVAPDIYRRAGIGPSDVDVALLYDAYSFLVLSQLEDFGLCERGTAGALVRAGGTAPAGDVPVNPHGGLLSEGSLHGFNNVLEAVRQLRGDAGVNQVPNAEVALCAGFGGSYGGAAVLTRG